MCKKTVIRAISYVKILKRPLFSSKWLRKEKMGLFSCEFPLLQPQDFISSANKATSRCDSIKKSLYNYLDPKTFTIDANIDMKSVRKALTLMDAMSNEICRVIDSAEPCRHLHQNEEFIRASQDAFDILSSSISELNSDVKLYRLLSNFLENDLIKSQLSIEDLIFLEDLHREYEDNGIHLNPTALEKVKLLQSKVQYYETEYSRNCSMKDDKIFAIGPINDKRMYDSLKEWLKPYIPHDIFMSMTEKHLLCTSNKYVSNRVMTSVADESVRKQIYLNSYSQPSENEEILGNLIKTRHELSRLQGHDNYCDKLFSSGRHVMQSSSEVMNFLYMINDSLDYKIEKEIKILHDMKNYSKTGQFQIISNIKMKSVVRIRSCQGLSLGCELSHVDTSIIYEVDFVSIKHSSGVESLFFC